MNYKVFFHRGDELSLRTKVERGEVWLDDAGLHISNTSEFLIPSADLLAAELFRLHGLGRVIRVEHRQGRLFLSVIRLMIGQFAFINFLKTGKLHKELVAVVSPKQVVEKTGS
ncbi:MAG: hypothetical protein WAQ52_12985 [Terriglobales bacterium]